MFNSSKSGRTGLNRRDLLKGTAAMGFTAALTGVSAREEVIRAENDRLGTTDWILNNTRVDPQTKYRCPWIEGYCSRTSVRPGETIEFKVSTNPPSAIPTDLYRMGYSHGRGGRHIARFGPIQGSPTPDPPEGKVRLRECTWQTAMRLTVPAQWTSGVYLAKLTEQREMLQSYIVFIVR